jgi:glycosyltransferase involved in cell wall biosynthesis
MHLLLIHQAFVAPHDPGGTRHYELAKHLVDTGHRVTVVTSSLSYLTGLRVNEQAESVEESARGMRIIRVYTYPSLHKSFFWRAISFLSFMFTSVFGALRAGKVDIVMGTSPPIFQAVSAWVVSRLRNRPFLLEIRDLWPEFAIDLGVLTNQGLIGAARLLEAFLYARAARMLVNSPAYLDYLTAKGVPQRKISLISNGADPDLFSKEDGQEVREELGLNGQFVVSYTGALGLANDIPTILRAADRMRDQRDIRFLLVGDGKERAKLESMAAQMELENVTFLEARAKSEIARVLAASDACVATLKDIPMFRTTYPNKVFDYMAAGRPTILAIDGVIREVIESARGGICVPPGDDAALADAVRVLRSDRRKCEEMGKAARAYMVEHFNRHKQASEFAELLKSLRSLRAAASQAPDIAC